MTAAGTALLVAALASALAGGVLAASGRLRAARVVLAAALAAVASAVVIVEIALIAGDDSLAYVSRVSEPALPLYYRVTALWSALEGSLLLWLLGFAVVAAVFALRPPRGLPEPSLRVATPVLAALVAIFAAVSLIASPFGDGGAGAPSPLLQDHPAMGIHPPLLYAGFVALAVPYALGIAALTAGPADTGWARAVRGWLLTAWVALTAGILVGAWWSYAVLGWGGYWAWDPVENASLMPWLVATAGLHALAPGAGWARTPRWAVMLSGIPFLLVLVATFLTRSGVIESIHAFSVSPLGPLLLVVLGVATGAWVVVAVRGRSRVRRGAPAPATSRQSLLAVNHIVLLLVTAIVLVGSVIPGVLLATAGERVSVGPPWYERTLAPLALVLLVAMAVGPWLAWSGHGMRSLGRRLAWPAAAAAVAGGAAGILVPDAVLAVAAAIAGFVAATLVLRVARRVPRPVPRIGALLAHLGIAVGAVAVVAGSHAVVVEQTVPIGGSATAGNASATLLSIERDDDGRRLIARARLLISEGGEPVGELRPELRWYEQQEAMLAGPAIRPEPLHDVYVTLLDVDPAAETATIRLAIEPGMSWLWGAGALTVAGGIVAGAASKRRPARPAGRGLDEPGARRPVEEGVGT